MTLNYTKIDGLGIEYSSEEQFWEGPHHQSWQGGYVHYLHSVDAGDVVFHDPKKWNGYAAKSDLPNWEDLENRLNE